MLLFIILGLCALYLIWMVRLYRDREEPPLLHGMLPLIGHGHWLFGNTVEMYKNTVIKMSEICSEKGGVMSIYLGLAKNYVITDPEDCLTAMNACLNKHYIYKFTKPLLGNGLITADDHLWTKNRKLLNPAFSQKVLDSFISIFNSQAQELGNQFEKELGREFNHETPIRNNNLVTICSTAMGVDVDEFESLENQYVCIFEEMVTNVNERIKKICYHPDFIFNNSLLKKKTMKCAEYLTEFTDTIIQKKRAQFKSVLHLEDRPKKAHNFMDLILELTMDDTNKSTFTDEEIRSEINTIIAAGYDTTAASLTYVLTALGSYSHVQNKAYEEVLQVFGNSDIYVSKQDLSKLIYIEAVIKETSRLYPAVPFIGRHVDKDVKLRNYTLRANTDCLIFVHGASRHKIWGPDADEFRPERWFEKETLPDLKYHASFGFGRRSCTGKTYALMSMKIYVAHILQKYLIKSDISKMKLKMETLTRPASGHEITLEKRIS